MSNTTSTDPLPLDFRSRPREADRPTRAPLPFFDRVKFLILLNVLFGLIVVVKYNDNPLLTRADALTETFNEYWFLPALSALELVRQLHYLLAETVGRYHRFWRRRFQRLDASTRSVNPWTRFRVGRLVKIALFLGLVSVVIARVQDTSSLTAFVNLPATVWSVLPFFIQVAITVSILILQFAALFWFLSRGGIDVYMPSEIETRFADVKGQDQVIDRIKENLVILDAPDEIEARGGYVPSGILLWGPPGTGKTLIAEAVAGETGKPFVFVEPSAFINMFLGVGPLKVRSLFRKLRKLSMRFGGVVVFFDEADALGNRGSMRDSAGGTPPAQSSDHMMGDLRWLSPRARSLILSSGGSRSVLPNDGKNRIIVGGGGGGGGGMGTLQSMLAEISGLKKPRGFANRVRRTLGMRPKPPPNYRILMIMATNMPGALDEALLRPGRIDRMYRVGYPSKVGRIETLRFYLSRTRHQVTSDEMERFALMSPETSGAAIKDYVNEALINALREGRDTVTWDDLTRARRVKQLGPPQDLEFLERERHAVAIHEACHAYVQYCVARYRTIDVATIEPGLGYLGMVSSIDPNELHTRWKSAYEADIMICMASLVGERSFFDGDSTSGVSEDLEWATTLAAFMEGYWGMGRGLASHAIGRRLGLALGNTRPDEEFNEPNPIPSGSGALARRIDDLLSEQYARTAELIREGRSSILALAHALELYRSVDGVDVEAIFEFRRGPLVDGSAYAQLGVSERLEDYHAQVLSAHKRAEESDAVLPVFTVVGASMSSGISSSSSAWLDAEDVAIVDDPPDDGPPSDSPDDSWP